MAALAQTGANAFEIDNSSFAASISSDYGNLRLLRQPEVAVNPLSRTLHRVKRLPRLEIAPTACAFFYNGNR